MRYRIPSLSLDLQLEPAAGGDGPPGYAVSLGSVRVGLTAPAVAFLLLVDGTRTVENLEDVAASMGMGLPEGFAGQLLEALIGAGLGVWVRADDLETQAFPGLAHRCDGCGRSCQGHLVGPLPDSEIATIQRIWPELVERVPRLSGVQPLVRRAESGVYLQQQGGQCVFLEPDARCAIHREFSALHKPTICRMFPYQRVLTEQGVRLGVSAACYRHTATVASAPATQTDALPEIVLDRESYQQLPLSAPPRGREEAIAEQARWERLLAGEKLPWPDVAVSQPLLARFQSRVRDQTWAGGLLEAQTDVAAGFRELLGAVDAPPAAPVATAQAALRELLVRMHFLHETRVLGGPARALAVMTLGLQLACRIAGPVDERLVAWFWLMTTESAHALLLDTRREVRAVLGT